MAIGSFVYWLGLQAFAPSLVPEDRSSLDLALIRDHQAH